MAGGDSCACGLRRLARCTAAAAAALAHVALASPVGLRGSGESAPKVEVVVARFREDPSWTSKYASPNVSFTIYNKGPALIEQVRAVPLPNVGRESHTYLWHIVQNYDKLAPWTVFTQGSEPAWGYRNGDPSSGHLTDKIDFKDYLVPHRNGGDSFFAISGVTHLPSGMQATRLGMLSDKFEELSNSICPEGGAKGWGAWWLEPEHPHHAHGKRMLDFYHRFVAEDSSEESVTLGFVQGARFAMSRARIHARPLEFYKALLQKVSASESPLEGYFLEGSWVDVFFPERLQTASKLCTYPELPEDRAMSLEEMYEDTAQRLAALGLDDGSLYARSLQAYNPKSVDGSACGLGPGGFMAALSLVTAIILGVSP